MQHIAPAPGLADLKALAEGVVVVAVAVAVRGHRVQRTEGEEEGEGPAASLPLAAADSTHQAVAPAFWHAAAGADWMFNKAARV